MKYTLFAPFFIRLPPDSDFCPLIQIFAHCFGLLPPALAGGQEGEIVVALAPFLHMQ